MSGEPMIEICSACLAPRPCVCNRAGRPWSKPKAIQRWRSRRYLEFVRAMPCAVPDCETWASAEAHHVGPRGAGEKVHDFLAIPLCRRHHEEAHAQGRAWRHYRDLHRWQVQTMAAAILAGVLDRRERAEDHGASNPRE